MNPNERQTTRLLLAAGILAAVCWTIADMLLVGFVPQPERYPLFSQTLAAQLGDDADMAVLMLSASPVRLFWGVLPATFSLVFYLAAAFGVYRIMRRGRAAAVCPALLLTAYALSPLGHAGFYYVGMSAQTLAQSTPDNYALLLAQFTRFHHLLAVHWFASVACSAAAWLVLLFQTACGNTLLPRSAAWFNPLPVGVALAAACSLFPDSATAAAVGSATFNLSQLVFFAHALICLRDKRPSENPNA